MRLDEAKAADQVTDEDVRLAEAEAAEVAELARELERRAIEDPKPPRTADVVEQRELASFAARRAERTRSLADQAKAANRLLALDQIGQDVAAYAAEAARPNTGIAKAAAELQAAAATLTALCAEHDAKVIALVDRATVHGVEAAVPSGPRATSAHVAVVPRRYHELGGIQAGQTVVRRIGPRAAEAIQRAIAGDADGAIAHIGAVLQPPPVKRADRYYRAPGGHIVTQDGPESTEFAGQVRKGQLHRLTDDDADLYLAGRLDHG